MEERPLVILAETYEQFRDYCVAKRLPRHGRSVTHADSIERLHGLDNFDVVRIGPYWKLSQLMRIEEFLRTRRGVRHLPDEFDWR